MNKSDTFFKPVKPSVGKKKFFKKLSRVNRKPEKKTQPINFKAKVKILVWAICGVVCAYQLGKFLELYYSYPTSVDAILINEKHSRIPQITVCYSMEYLVFLLRSLNSDFKEALNQTDENRSAMLSRTNFSFIGVKECKFVHTNATRVTIEQCASTQVFTGRDLSRVINAVWSNESLNNFTGFIEFSFELDFALGSKELTDTGAFVFVASSDSVPTNDVRAFFVEPSNEIKLTFKKTVVQLMPPPYKTMCRNYTADLEKSRQWGNFGHETCYYSCLWSTLHSVCGCIPMPIPFILPYNVGCYYEEKINCTYLVNISKLEKDCNAQCPLACLTEHYEYNASKMKTVKNKNDTVIFIELRGNVDAAFIHKPEFSPLELVSNIGGYLGLWLGMSIPLMYDIVTTILMKSIWWYNKIISINVRDCK